MQVELRRYDVGPLHISYMRLAREQSEEELCEQNGVQVTQALRHDAYLRFTAESAAIA